MTFPTELLERSVRRSTRVVVPSTTSILGVFIFVIPDSCVDGGLLVCVLLFWSVPAASQKQQPITADDADWQLAAGLSFEKIAAWTTLLPGQEPYFSSVVAFLTE